MDVQQAAMTRDERRGTQVAMTLATGGELEAGAVGTSGGVSCASASRVTAESELLRRG